MSPQFKWKRKCTKGTIKKEGSLEKKHTLCVGESQECTKRTKRTKNKNKKANECYGDRERGWERGAQNKSRAHRTLRVCNVHREEAHTIHMICYCKWIRSKLSLADKHTTQRGTHHSIRTHSLACSLAHSPSIVDPSSCLIELLYSFSGVKIYISHWQMHTHCCCWWRASACMRKHLYTYSRSLSRERDTCQRILVHLVSIRTHTPNSNDYRISTPFHRILFYSVECSIRLYVRSLARLFIRIKHTTHSIGMACHIHIPSICCYVRSHLTWCSLLNLFTAHLLLMLMLLASAARLLPLLFFVLK